MTRSTDLDIIAPDDPVIDVIPKKSEKFDEQNINIEEKTEKEVKKKENDKVREILGHTRHSLSATIIYPDTFDFAEREDSEKILVVLRPHWITNLHWLIVTFFMLIAPIFFKTIPFVAPLSSNIMIIVFLFWYLATFAFALEKFISWYFDIFMVTNTRVIDIDIHNLLDSKFSEAQIRRIQNTSYHVSGVFHTIFNYGSVKIETAGENPDIVFEDIASPGKIIKLLQNLCEKNAPTNK